MKKIQNMIFVRFEKEGIHKYPTAGIDPMLKDVAFLAVPHRHIFKFQVQIEVFHNDRDIEFILFKRWLQSLYDTKVLELDYKSCEMIADDLADVIQAEYPGRDIAIEIAEDGENGCRCYYEADGVQLVEDGDNLIEEKTIIEPIDVIDTSNNHKEMIELHSIKTTTNQHLLFINTDIMSIADVQIISEHALRLVEKRLGLGRTRKRIEQSEGFNAEWDKMIQTLESYKVDESIIRDITTKHGMVTKVSTHLSEKLKDANSMESKGFASLKKEAEKLIMEFLLPSVTPTISSATASVTSDKK